MRRPRRQSRVSMLLVSQVALEPPGVACCYRGTLWIVLTFDSSDVQVFTVHRCTDIVEKANTSGHVTEESSISVCRKHYQSKETCGLLSEMLSLALIRGDFNKFSFCEMMSSAHGCSTAMEDFLSSDVVADLAFGHCRRLRQNKTSEYCQRFKSVLSAAVKASETVDTLRECYMLELEQKSESTTATTTPLVVAVEAAPLAKIGGIVPAAVPVVTAQPVVAIAKVVENNQSRVPNALVVNASSIRSGVNASMMVNGTKGQAYAGFLSKFVG